MTGIDRDALVAILMEQWTAEPRETADRVLALVRPVEGVTLSPEEAAFAAKALRHSEWWWAQEDVDRAYALAARLEAAS